MYLFQIPYSLSHVIQGQIKREKSAFECVLVIWCPPIGSLEGPIFEYVHAAFFPTRSCVESRNDQ